VKVSAQPLDITKSKVKYCGFTVDTHAEDGATSVSCTCSATTQTNTVTLKGCDNAAVSLWNVKKSTLLMLRWRSFWEWGNECVVCLLHYIADQYIYFRWMLQCGSQIAESLRLKIVDTRLTLRLMISKQPLYTQHLDPMNCILILEIQHCISTHYLLHPEALWPLDFWSTSINDDWVRDDVTLPHSCAFNWQFTAYRLVR